MSMSEARDEMPSCRIADPSLTSAKINRCTISSSPIPRRCDLLAVVDDHLLDGGVRNRVATAGFVTIPPQSGLLAEATLFAQPIGDLRVLQIGLFAVAPLANGPADVVARQV